MYSLNKGLGAGSNLRSSTFSLGGYDWCIHYFPDGVLGDGNEGFIANLLKLLSINSEVRAFYEISLVDELTGSTWGWKPVAPTLFTTRDITKQCNVSGVHKLKRQSDLERVTPRCHEIIGFWLCRTLI